MIESPTANFSGSETALFSPSEIRSLMRAEHERAQRYGHDMTCLVIGIDRIEQLADFYGYESREDVLASVVELLHSRLRVGDFLGCRDGDDLVIALPFTPTAGARQLAQRLLEGAREILFSSEGRTLRISISIGAAYADDPGCRNFEQMFDVARGSLREAAAAGGGRFVEKRLGEGEASAQHALRDELEQRMQLLRDSLQTVTPESSELPTERTLADKLRELLESDPSLRGDNSGLQRQIQELMQQHNRQIDVLGRRIGKLSTSLEATEDQLNRMVLMRDVDPGVASIYRTVQGLDSTGADSEAKQGIMSAIFDANVLLQEQISSRAEDR